MKYFEIEVFVLALQSMSAQFSGELTDG